MCVNIKVKYIGTNTELFTVDQIYTVLAMDGSTGSQGRYIILADDSKPYVVSPFGSSPDVELVSIVQSSQVQIYP